MGEKKKQAITKIAHLNQEILNTKSLADFEGYMLEHEAIIAEVIDMPKVKDLYFTDLKGVAKSLGAWGGDFVLLSHQGGLDTLKNYCQLKGFEVVIPYQQMIL